MTRVVLSVIIATMITVCQETYGQGLLVGAPSSCKTSVSGCPSYGSDRECNTCCRAAGCDRGDCDFYNCKCTGCDCYETCIRTRYLYWQRFCSGTNGLQLWCYENQILSIGKGMFGDFQCTASSERMATYPTCVKDVKSIIEPLCTDKNKCILSVNTDTFGKTDCKTENFYTEYFCGWTSEYCHRNCSSIPGR